ncbi:signal transduction histidine kinase [Nocardiopsis mwathae]|uniref:histidine kinase n=1 Tax=Nocardiopsis mwathae TaxID=1472723 RepID=A0A7W9YI31_9ACTN|nr:sensor domain-containing protein [Nocardiopsis mwathae]MBB6171596.1 signal transduction histidine kinase [Nocardiopsis mwathae]
MAGIDYQRASRTNLLAWSLLFVAHAATGLLLLTLYALATVLSLLWVGLPLIVLLTPLIRGHADTHRTMLGHFLPDGPIPTPYHPLPPTGISHRAGAILTDPTTWRDLTWLLVNGLFGAVIAALPAMLIAQAAHLTLYSTLLWRDDPTYYGLIPPTDQTGALITLLPALLLILVYWVITPISVTGYAHLNRWLLAPNEKTRLAERVAHLATSRAETIDAQASEVRRIERDLHDGAQARLVALGMSLGMAEQMLARDPHTAQQLLTEARDATRQALTELRDLVRGIHPPVLVERGLDGAVRALAVTQHLPIDVDIDLPGRLAAPVESAAYFAIAEILTNAAKHADATRAWVRINHGGDRLVLLVGDDGKGGADLTKGTGLQGIRRRLGAFDGTISIVSPAGGPTIVTMELPCVLSSPKTSPSSAMD